MGEKHVLSTELTEMGKPDKHIIKSLIPKSTAFDGNWSWCPECEEHPTILLVIIFRKIQNYRLTLFLILQTIKQQPSNVLDTTNILNKRMMLS